MQNYNATSTFASKEMMMFCFYILCDHQPLHLGYDIGFLHITLKDISLCIYIDKQSKDTSPLQGDQRRKSKIMSNYKVDIMFDFEYSVFPFMW